MNHVIRIGLLLMAATLSIPASAQDSDRFDLQQLRPGPTMWSNAIGLYQARVMPDSAFEIGLHFHYSDDPLVVRAAAGEDDRIGDRLHSVVGSHANVHLLGGFGLFDRLELAADIPLIVSQTGDEIGPLPNLDVDASDAGFGIGDIRLAAKVLLFNTHTNEDPGGGAMSLVLDAQFPIGDSAAFQGGDLRFTPTLAIDAVSAPGHRFTFNFGYTVRPAAQLADLQVDDTFNFGFAADFAPNQYVHVIPEVRGSLSVLADDITSVEAPVEALMAIRIFPTDYLNFQAGGGVGLTQGFGTPDWRVLFAASYTRHPPQDRDGDGIVNDEDECPDDPEDMDEWEDVDGCPDPDNDQDGILDDPDECPIQPEDLDDFEDEDGCPDPDNDADEILDEPDQCPNEAEDRDGFEDEDGCPDPDNDRDGILDEPDQCPDEAEDQDGFEDEDGCPDPDNDGDGILDEPDHCPDEAEDMNGVDDEDGCPEIDTDGDGLLDPVDQSIHEPEDADGFEDEDGCPDPDNDGDGILDEPDQCPLEPETRNGHQDEDGCPDEALVEVTCERIVIHQQVFFVTNSDQIRDVSFELLDAVAAVFVARPDITKVRVEGHTDSRGGDRHNMELSERRAASVRRYLEAHGVEGSRLESHGYGETRPIESNRTAAGRAQNRRVEFVILEQTGCTEEQTQAHQTPNVPVP